VGKSPTTTDDKHHTFFVQDVTNLEANLNRFWEVEQVKSSSMTIKQQDCEQHLTTHTTRQPDGRFTVRLPVTGDPNQLGTSRHSAENRLLAIERRLERDPDLKTEYHRFMSEYEELDHMEPVTTSDKTTTC
jgi:hypothetical protein